MNAIAFRLIRHTTHFDEMLAFYRDTLGLTVTHSWDRGPTDRGALLSFGPNTANTEVEVLRLGDVAQPDAGPPANTELSIEVPEVDTLHDKLVAADAIIARGLEVTPWGHRSFGIDDPDGMRLWFYQVVE